MLRIFEQTALAAAKSYYSTSDYFSEGQELQGVWCGKGAAKLDLSGVIAQRDWDALCDNHHPQSGQQLTVRQKSPRRIGWDFNFSVPKSVSLLYGLTNDQRILDAFTEVVDQTMSDIESELKTRVRTKGRNFDRISGTGVWGRYIHFTSRPVNGISDPQLHSHCVFFNTVWDDSESRWKAAQIGDIKRDANYFSAVMHNRLAARLTEMGLPIERTAKSWRIAGISAATEAKFSRRTQQINAEAERRGITDPEEKAALGALTRDHKNKHLSMDQLRRSWFQRLLPAEAEVIVKLHRGIGTPVAMKDLEGHAQAAVFHAANHHFQKDSVVPERKLLTTALHHAIGRSTVESVHRALADAHLIEGEENGQKLVTSQSVLEEERQMIRFAREGRNAAEPLAPNPSVPDWFNDGQRKAMEHLCNSHSKIMLLGGQAGTGKTTLLSTVREEIERHGRQLLAFAPSAEAGRGVLREAGFTNSETVAMLLADPKIHEAVRGQTVLIDEAGQIGTRTMARVFDLAERLNARVILCGDIAQHRPTERGEALRLLQQEAGLRSATVSEVIRQRDQYKQAVTHLSAGRTEKGLQILDQLNWIHEIPDSRTRYERIAAEYLQTVEMGRSVAVIAPTHSEKQKVSLAIRSALQNEGKIGTDSVSILKLTDRRLSDAQKCDIASYADHDVLVFTQNAPGYRKGTRLTVGTDRIPLHLAERFTVCHAGRIEVAKGDRIRITAGGVSADGHRLSNGQGFEVRRVARDGTLTLNNGWHIGPSYGQIDHNYCTTSYAAQGQNREKVILAVASESYPAASPEQVYVSVSRGRSACAIYVDEQKGFLEAVRSSGHRMSATELAAQRHQVLRQVMINPAMTHQPVEEMAHAY